MIAFLFALVVAEVVPAVPLRAQTAAWNWSEFMRLEFENGGVSLHVGPVAMVLLIIVVIGLVVAWIVRLRKRLPKWDTTAVKMRFGNLGEVEIRPNYDTVRIAYQAWVEIRTRKVGLPFEEDHDVIAEVYDSWYDMFGVLRELTKSIPAHRLRECEDTRKLVGIMLGVLNEGLRPHLTRWQAKFRRWYEAATELPANRKKTPQEIQKAYPQYGELVNDLKRVNAEFVGFSRSLGSLAQGKKGG